MQPIAVPISWLTNMDRGEERGPVSEATAISITECKGWGKDVDNRYIIPFEFGKYMRSDCDIACNSKPCWNLIFEKELGAALIIV
uniref:Uncharacterized protein n=1 Tax=Populus trichocarpa TaxID=3694 RepID=A0A2K1X876_POPTR